MTGMRAQTAYLHGQIRELASLGVTRTRMAQLLHHHPTRVGQIVKMYALDVPRERAGWEPHRERSRKRAEVMLALYRDGYTLAQIGQQFGVTRERVRQLMTKHFGTSQEDGGQHAKALRKASRRAADREARYFKKYGCSYEQWMELRRIGQQMIASGKGLYQTPLRAWSNQRNNAIRRGIGWELNVWQWWTVWQQSGHWEHRGRGQGYVMCRKGDDGPYAIGNVFIASAAQNSHEGQRKHRPSDLPVGVRRNKSGTFTAHRSFGGKLRRLGTFQTPELAYAAYLMAAPQQAVAA